MGQEEDDERYDYALERAEAARAAAEAQRRAVELARLKAERLAALHAERLAISRENERLAPVGSFRPNRWGLFDMHGNASEWVEDWYGPYDKEHQIDPRGPAKGTERVRRGGSFEIIPKNCDAVKRNNSELSYRSDDVGFRLVREVEPPR